MRSAALLTLLLTACGLRDYLPRGPTLEGRALETWMEGGNEPVTYLGEARVEFPVIPFQLFGLRYAEDIVLETNHPHWTMHEYARIEVGERDLWIAKDSDGAGLQTVTADLDAIEGWLPEVPVPRRHGAVDVQDRSTPERLDVTLRYTNPLGEAVVVDFAAPRDAPLEKKRNGSTFNHSQQAAAVLLDIPRRQLTHTSAKMSFDGQPASIHRVLGLVPVKALLEQTQAGFAVASMLLQTLDADHVNVIRPLAGTPWPTASSDVWSLQCRPADTCQLDAEDQVAMRRYTYSQGELVSAGIRSPGADEPFVTLNLSRPLPDLRRPFQGEVVRHFALQFGTATHGHGELRARWLDDQEVQVQILPLEPFWFAARPMQTRIRYLDDGSVAITTERVD